VSPRFRTRSQIISKKSPLPFSTPNSLGNWPAMMVSASPMMKPLSTGSEMKLATKPSRVRPARMPITPAVIASAAVSVTNSLLPAVANCATAAADSAAVADIGPVMRCRELPKTAYRIRAPGAA
jgi:hypothetical protein